MSDNAQFIRSLQEATERMILEEAQRVERACLIVERNAKQDCPVDMGVLRASITSEVEVTTSAIIGRIGSNEEYATYVHNGHGIYAVQGNGRRTPWAYNVRAGSHRGFHVTVGQRPQPFLKNAIFSSQGEISRTLGG